MTNSWKVACMGNSVCGTGSEPESDTSTYIIFATRYGVG